MQGLNVAVQNLLGYLVSVWVFSEAPPFVIPAAGDTKQLAKHRDRIAPMKRCYPLIVITVLLLLSAAPPFQFDAFFSLR